MTNGINVLTCFRKNVWEFWEYIARRKSGGKFINFWSATMRERQFNPIRQAIFLLRIVLSIEEKALDPRLKIRLCVQYQKIKTAFPNFEAFDKIQSCPIKERLRIGEQSKRLRIYEKDQPYPSRMRLGHWSKCKAKVHFSDWHKIEILRNCQMALLIKNCKLPLF